MFKKNLSLFLFLLCLVFSAMAGECFAVAGVPPILEQAKTQDAKGQYEQAAVLYQQTLTEQPGSEYAAEAQFHLAKVKILLLMESNNDAAAQAAADALIAVYQGNPDLPKALYGIANKYEWAGKYKQAKDAYQLILDHCQGSPDAAKSNLHVSRTNVLALIDSKNFDAAGAALDKFIVDFDGNSFILTHLKNSIMS